MLSLQLRRCFATIGARLRVRTDPKSESVTLVLRRDVRGSYFELALPRLTRNIVAVLAVHPRRKRILLQLTHGGRRGFVMVQMYPQPAIRAIDASQVQALSVERREAA